MRTPFGTQNVTVRLDCAQIVLLDRLATQIRARHGAALSRSGILRALVSGMLAVRRGACDSQR